MEEATIMEETPAMGFPRRFIGIIFYPGRVFQSLRAKPAVLAPLVLVAIIAAASVPLLAPLNTQLAKEQILKRNPQATQEEIEQVQQVMTGTGVMVAGAIAAVIFTPLVMMFYALLFRTIFNVGMGGMPPLKRCSP